MSLQNKIKNTTLCYHCGDNCANQIVKAYDKSFCCEGCKMVFEIINKKGLCTYYDLESMPGITQKTKVREGKFAFLNDESIRAQLIHFTLGKQSHVKFYLPQMHCSSCVWLLENLHQLNENIIKSQVNFLKKEITIVYTHSKLSLQSIAEILTSIGYEPHISLNTVSTKSVKKINRSKIYKIGISGFCFANIMMLSFPEYFSIGNENNENLMRYFSFINLGLSLPVFFYAASEFFISSYKSLKQNFLNIDAPIALALIITFSRSVYEIISGNGVGYLDSMSGIVFFMLIGRYFQDYTYETLSFERDYKSYIPLGVTLINADKTESQIPISKLKIGDRIKIHHGEIIPADSILFLGKAFIDYSFVTGESLPVEKTIGEIIYAGGKQTIGSIELEIVKEVSQSYLTQLWNNEIFSEKDKKGNSFIHLVSKYFTVVLFSIALFTSIYWQINNPKNILNSVTAILIVACPCALLLSATFTHGNILRFLARHKFYLKNADVVENIAKANVIVFDKTGTITSQEDSVITYNGESLSGHEQSYIKSLCSQSNHPLSVFIAAHLSSSESFPVTEFENIISKGICGKVNSNFIQIGNHHYLNIVPNATIKQDTQVYIKINGVYKGYFIIQNKYRPDLAKIISTLKRNYPVYVISGDNENERENLISIFGEETPLFFNQSPEDKLNFIKKLQHHNTRVMMFGDGLNDAGALKQSSVGVAISDNLNNFSPACDAILHGDNFSQLSSFINYCKEDKKIILASFVISILYNIIGLSFAVQGLLSPVIAAILMPISSISIVLLTTGSAWLFSFKLKPLNYDKSHA